MEAKFAHRQEVIVLDRLGQYELRGKIAAIYVGNPTMYDIVPSNPNSSIGTICGMPEAQLRPVGNPVLAYERRETQPKHIMDEA